MPSYEEKKLLLRSSFLSSEPPISFPLSLLEDALEYPTDDKKRKNKNVPKRYHLN